MNYCFSWMLLNSYVVARKKTKWRLQNTLNYEMISNTIKKCKLIFWWTTCGPWCLLNSVLVVRKYKLNKSRSIVDTVYQKTINMLLIISLTILARLNSVPISEEVVSQPIDCRASTGSQSELQWSNSIVSNTLAYFLVQFLFACNELQP